MKYAVIDNNHSFSNLVNVGDHIQSLAGQQFLPQVDFYVERDRLNDPAYEEAKIILNGWHTYHSENWPPNPKLDPKIISFHINPGLAPAFFSNPKTVAYLKEKGPIGCRDYSTLRLMEEHGIDAYYSFCLTTTLDEKYKTEEKTDKVYLADVFYDYDLRTVYKANPKKLIFHTANGKIFKRLNLPKKKRLLQEHVNSDVLQNAEVIDHIISSKQTSQEKFAIGEEILKKYASAKLVITSRIHAALPCLALGTPVLFLTDGLEKESIHTSRLKGTIDHLNILSTRSKKEIDGIFDNDMNVLHPEDIDWNNPPQNPNTHTALSEKLKETCKAFIKG